MKRILPTLALIVLAGQAVAGNYIGEYAPGDTIDCKFTTYRPSTGATFTLGGTPAVSAYKDNSTTQSTTGVTLSADFDTVTGLNHVRVTTASDGTFYSAGSFFSLIITTGSVDSVSVTGSEVCSFSLNKEAGLRPTTAARTLDVSAGGEAGLDWANIGSPTTTVNLSGTSTKALEPTTAGRTLDVTATGEAGIDWANVGSPTTAVNLSGTTISTSQAVASVSGAVGSVTGAVGSVTGNVGGNVTGSVGSVATGGITAASLASDAITAAKVAADVSSEFSAATFTVNATQISGDSTAADTLETWLDGTAGSAIPLGIVDQGTAQSATGTTLVLRSALAIADDAANGMTLVACGSTQGYCQARAVTDYVSSTDTATVDTWTVTPSGTVTYYLFATAPSSGAGGGLDAAGVRAAIGLASANLDTQLGAIDDYVDTEVAAIKTKTDFLPSATAGAAGGVFIAGTNAATTVTTSFTTTFTGNLTGSVGSVATGGITAASIATDAIGAAELAADAVTEIQSGLSTLNAAGVRSAVGLASANLDTQLDALPTAAENADAVWDEARTGHTTAGTFGFYLDSAISGVSTGGVSAGAIADAVWDEATTGHTTSGTFGESLKTNVDTLLTRMGTPSDLGGGATVAANLSDIEAQTDDIGAAGAGLTAADDAVMTRLGTPSGASVSADIATRSSQTSVDDLPTNAELATSQASADDATLAAIAALNNLSATDVASITIEDQGGGVSLRCALSIVLAYAAGDLATSGGTSTYEDPSGTETRISGTAPSAGNRSATITCPSY